MPPCCPSTAASPCAGSTSARICSYSTRPRPPAPPGGWSASAAATRCCILWVELQAAVRVQTLEEQVHDRVVEHHGRESDDGEPGRTRTPPAAGRPCVDVPGVDHPDDERPHLFGVPAPVATPGAFGPDGTGDEGEGPEDEPDHGDQVGEVLELHRIRKRLQQGEGLLACFAPGLQQLGYGEPGADGEEG